LNWNPNLRAPLKTPGVNVREGEYLIAVNNEEVRPPQSVYEPFAGTAGKQITITVADNPEGEDARQVTVVPVSSESNIRYLNWVEENREYVNEQTDGHVAYVHVPNTADYGHEMFKRYFYPQSHKDALILDERHNGGGLIADYYIDFLRRQYISHWNFRYGNDLISPRGAILGPKVMLADETAGSGGDLLPWMFKKFEIGPVIGKRTWGGLVGILGFPVLRDGGSVTAPNLAFWTEEDGFAVENEGVAPDIEVEQWPAEVMQGRDPQLDRAIQEVMQMLEENPPREYERPDYPVRVDE
jgi:tricorn protease